MILEFCVRTVGGGGVVWVGLEVGDCEVGEEEGEPDGLPLGDWVWPPVGD